MVFIEAKAVKIELEHPEAEQQLLKYCFKWSVNLGILTNGLSWWFYLPMEKGSWYERKFFVIDLIQQDAESIVARFSGFLLKGDVLNGKALENAKKTYQSKQKQQIVKKTLPEAWKTLVSSEDEGFIDLFNNYIEKICGFRAENQEVVDFLDKNRTQLLIPDEKVISAYKKTEGIEVESDAKIESKGKPSKYAPTGYTGKSVAGFTFNGKHYGSKSWKELLLSICEMTSDSHKAEFQKVLSLKGRRRPYFSLEKNELRVPEKIKGTNIFVETNLSANSIVSLCEDVLSILGYKNGLKIDTF